MKIMHITSQENNMEETYEESENDIIEYIHDCNCLKNSIKQKITQLINIPLTEGAIFCLCIYQFMIIWVMYAFIMRMNMVEYFLQFFASIVVDDDTIISDTIIARISQIIKIMMRLHLIFELRIFIKALRCNCDGLN